MLHRLGLRAWSTLAGNRWGGSTAEGATLDSLRAALTPRSAEIQRALLALEECLEAVDWCARRVAATRDSALARVLEGLLEAERANACAALESLRRIDAFYAKSLCRLLFRSERRAEWRALGRRVPLVRAALARTARWRRANPASSSGERYGT